jgi:hypothetical protein
LADWPGWRKRLSSAMPSGVTKMELMDIGNQVDQSKILQMWYVVQEIEIRSMVHPNWNMTQRNKGPDYEE